MNAFMQNFAQDECHFHKTHHFFSASLIALCVGLTFAIFHAFVMAIFCKNSPT